MVSIIKKHKLLLKSAKTRGIKVKLNVKHYEELLQLGCMYCGIDLESQNGYCLDRIDNSKGYLDDNVTPCCKDCNMAKGTRSAEEFVSWIKRASEFQNELLKSIPIIQEREVIKLENKYMNSSKVRNSSSLEYNI
jgi:hypothetical protein